MIVLAPAMQAQSSLCDLVNPLIGTGGHGHCYPGATVPFGAVQLSPDTRNQGWDGCSGYHYSDKSILGFSHTHLSGTGCADMADLLIRPFTGHPATFSHANEHAEPGYYSVTLDNGTLCELTATAYCGMHRYTMPKADKGVKQHLILDIDLEHVLSPGERIAEAYLKENAPNQIVGMRRTAGWAPDRKIYFAIRFDRCISSSDVKRDYKEVGEKKYHIMTNMKVRFYNENTVTFKVATSTNSLEDALRNLDHDIKGYDFDNVRQRAHNTWEQELSRIRVDGGTDEQKKLFYTALYHTMLAPNIISDASEKHKRYSTLSLWDTYRAWSPLMTIINPTLVTDIINSMLAHYDEHGILPIWPIQKSETGCMIGYHAASIIWDAYQKGIRGFDAHKALRAMVASAEKNPKGAEYYGRYGYIPMDVNKESVSCTMEFAYDDWCIAQMASALNQPEIYHKFIERSRNYQNLFNGKTRFFAGRRLDGNFENRFDPALISSDYTEANAWHYRFAVPHDIGGLADMFGSQERVVEALDSMFTSKTRPKGDMPDVTGLIGQYAHGNEPCHHVAYLYAYYGQPAKTNAYVSRILDEMYHYRADGYCGNEDCGQMSAWYVLAAMGIYQPCPGSGEWVMTKPLFDKVTISGNNYAQRITSLINSRQEYGVTTLNGKWRGLPTSHYVSTPYCVNDIGEFAGSKRIELKCATKGATIHYTTNGTEPTAKSPIYRGGITITKSTTLKFKAFKSEYIPSLTVTIQATKIQ